MTKTTVIFLIFTLFVLLVASVLIMIKVTSIKYAVKPVSEKIENTLPSDSSHSTFSLFVVLDDAGMNLASVQVLEKFNGDYTVAIIPRLQESKNIASYLYNKQIAYLVHLPMEPIGESYAGDYALSTQASEDELHNLIHYNLIDFDNFLGINNHMGSMATTDERVVDILLQFLQNNLDKMIILDSRTTEFTKLATRAIEMNFLTAIRDVFIDNFNDVLYIKNQIREGVTIAQKRGYAVLIGHVTKSETLQALIEMYDEVSEQGGSFHSIRDYEKITKISSNS